MSVRLHVLKAICIVLAIAIRIRPLWKLSNGMLLKLSAESLLETFQCKKQLFTFIRALLEHSGTVWTAGNG